MDKTYIDLGPKKGATVMLQFEPIPKKPFYIQVRDPKTGIRLYEREYDKDTLNLNLPTGSGELCFIIVGEPKIKQSLVTPLQKPNIPFDRLPTAKRPYKFSDFRIVANPNMPGFARMFTNKPVIEFNPHKMAQVSEPIQAFLLRHELGHYYFDDEKTTDRWAINRFLNDGYNLSSANYGLTHVLTLGPTNIERMKAGDEYLKELQKIYYHKEIQA